MTKICVAAVLVAVVAFADWHQVGSWAGEGTKETQTFTIRNREWRVGWKARLTYTAGLLSIGVYDDTDNLVSTITSGPKGGNDVSYVRSKPGKYYLKITAANVEWQVIVEDQ